MAMPPPSLVRRKLGMKRNDVKDKEKNRPPSDSESTDQEPPLDMTIDAPSPHSLSSSSAYSPSFTAQAEVALRYSIFQVVRFLLQLVGVKFLFSSDLNPESRVVAVQVTAELVSEAPFGHLNENNSDDDQSKNNKPLKRPWKVRQKGYIPGDLTRSIIRRGKLVRGAPVDTKYRFGDFTRGVLALPGGLSKTGKRRRPSSVLRSLVKRGSSRESLSRHVSDLSGMSTSSDASGVVVHEKRGTDSMVVDVVRPFEKAWTAANGQSGDMDLDHLLDALQAFQSNMHDVGQVALARVFENNIKQVIRVKDQAPKNAQKTLRSLMEWEAVHQKVKQGDKLVPTSASSSLLWIRRTVAFQCQFNEYLIRRPDVSTVQHALWSYEQELEPFHGWMLKKVFRTALRTTTPMRHTSLARLMKWDDHAIVDSQQETALLQEMQGLVDIWQPMLKGWLSLSQELDLEDDTKV